MQNFGSESLLNIYFLLDILKYVFGANKALGEILEISDVIS